MTASAEYPPRGVNVFAPLPGPPRPLRRLNLDFVFGIVRNVHPLFLNCLRNSLAVVRAQSAMSELITVIGVLASFEICG
jgi:hypothetical protein